ncbi:retrotransposon protein, putative, ty1-copia subclass [Tanacetum coccineum]
MALGITPVAIIDRQLPFEYTITSRSTDMVVGKDKQVYIPKPKNLKPFAKERPTKDDTCHHYKEVGHCKRNCLAYLAELIKKKKQVGTASSSYVFIIELFSFPTKSWVYDTSCVSKNNVFYFNAIPSNGIYEIDMHDLVPNVNSIYNVSTKRAKPNLDSTYLWHCRLAHISKKRIERLQQEGLLKSTDDESSDQCVSCLSSKMTRKLFPYRPERATDLLRIIYTDVCGPLRHVSRQGASYFIIFTDDYSCYGYVYLLKHKHEVFETFKVFKNKVENQLGKTIKTLRSDRGGEYISQEFKDYLKAYGIDYALESATRILNLVPTKKVDKTPYELWYEKVPNLSYSKVSGRAIDFEEIQDKDTLPSEITSEIPMEVEGFEPPQEEVIPVRRSERTHRAPNRLCLNVEAEEHSLGDLNEPTSYKALMLDSEYNKWTDDIYMVQPEGFVDPNHPRKVYKLKRSIYGLKQASRSWNKRFDEEIKRFGFDQNLDELCVYQKASGSNVTFLILSKRLIGLGQNAYMDKIFKRYKMNNSKRGHIPMEERLDLNKTQCAATPKEMKRMQNVPYASVVGSIMYAVRCTIPDVAFAQNITSRFQQNLGELHWTVVKNILKYLRNTKDMFLVYGGNPKAELRVDCYCDAGFKTDIDDMKSQT